MVETGTLINMRHTGRFRRAAFELFEEILNKGVNLRIKVTGRSMEPSLRSGDIVIVEPTHPGRLNTGDIVFYKNNQGLLVMHRLINVRNASCDEIIFMTKGDALKICDPPFDAKQVIGKIVQVERRKSQTVVLRDHMRMIINNVRSFLRNLKSGDMIK